MDLREAIHVAVESDPNGDPLVLAGSVLSKVTKADLLGLVATEIRIAQRTAVRNAERQVFRALFDNKPRGSRPVPPPSLRRLFKTPFAIGDGSRVNWLDATVEQHEERIARLAEMRNGLDRTIAQHVEAVRLIKEAGVSCLAELPDESFDQLTEAA